MQLSAITSISNAPRTGKYSDGRGIEINLTWLPHVLTPKRLAEMARDFVPLARQGEAQQKKVNASLSASEDSDAVKNLTALAETMEATDETAELVNSLYCKALVGYLEQWDVEQTPGVLLPVTYEGFMQLPLGLPEQLFKFCRDETEPKKKALTDGQTPTEISGTGTPTITPPTSATDTVTDTSQTTLTNLM